MLFFLQSSSTKTSLCLQPAIVLELCKKNNIPVQCSMGGGYSKEIKVIVDAHANTFRAAKYIFD